MDTGDRPAAAGRHYMNKMFGAGLDRARQEDEEQDKRGGTVSRITIEPREDGSGHRVTVERHSLVMHGAGGGGNDRAEHHFDKAEDALQFLHELMHGGEPGAESEREEPIDLAKRPPRGPGSDLESVLAAGDRDND